MLRETRPPLNPSPLRTASPENNAKRCLIDNKLTLPLPTHSPTHSPALPQTPLPRRLHRHAPPTPPGVHHVFRSDVINHLGATTTMTSTAAAVPSTTLHATIRPRRFVLLRRAYNYYCHVLGGPLTTMTTST